MGSELCKFHCCSLHHLLLHFINYQHFPSPLRARSERHSLPWGGTHTPPCCQLQTTEGLGGKRGAESWERQIPNSWSSSDTEGGRAAPGRVRAGVTATLCPLWAGSCTPPKGADDFLLGMEDSGSWQKLTLVFWLLVGKGGGCRFSPVGWRWPQYPQPKCCSANYQMLLHWMEITLLSIQRTDNGLLSSQNTGKKVCEQQMCRLLFPSYNGDGNALQPAALRQGNKQPVLIIELHIA